MGRNTTSVYSVSASLFLGTIAALTSINPSDLPLEQWTGSNTVSVGLAANASMDSDVPAGTIMRLTLKNGVNINLSGRSNGGMVNSWQNGTDGDSRLVWVPIGNNRGYLMIEGTRLVLSSNDAKNKTEVWQLVPGAWQQIWEFRPDRESGSYKIFLAGSNQVLNIPYSKHNVRVNLMPDVGFDADQAFFLNIVGRVMSLPDINIVYPPKTEYVWPVRGSACNISQLAGDSFSHKNYSGVDFATGTTNPPVYAVYGGTVLQSAFTNDGGGNTVKVLSDNGEIQFYWHLNSRAVSINQKIAQGQSIGTVGRTGNSTGNHLHLEFRTSDGKLNWDRATRFQKALGLAVGKTCPN
jgi:murein DD-endopeptidase MepM/ murein hydrolase activator NlpD